MSDRFGHRAIDQDPRENPATRTRLSWARVTALATLTALVACSAEDAPAPAANPTSPSQAGAETASEPAPAEPAAASAADLVARGRSVWMSNCVACHAQDPALDGALGPAVIGSSRELLEARVLRAEYPPGYTPKRDSGMMIALPHLANEIDALHAYLKQ